VYAEKLPRSTDLSTDNSIKTNDETYTWIITEADRSAITVLFPDEY
jgi:hypothetical protein